jgi:hypothetical protein
MELDDLKYQLKHKLSTDQAGRSDEDIAALLTKRTGSIVDKLKRSLWIEIIFGILIFIAFGYIGFFSNYHWLRIYFSVFSVLTAAFLILLIYLLRRTSKLSATALPVKSNLQSIVHIIEEFVSRYFQFTMALIPVCFIFAFLLGSNDPKPIPAAEHFAKNMFSSRGQVIIFLLAYFLLLTIGIYYFTKWYLKKLYGKYVSQLKECIDELKEE